MTILSNPIYLWIIVGLLLLLVELMTPGFVVACFGVGAFLAIIPAALGVSVTWQVLTFCLGSILSLLLLRPLLHRFEKGKPPTPTGVSALYGRVARVTESIDASHQSGRIAIDGDSWRARTVSPEIIIRQGEMVRIISNDSIVMIVEPLEITSKQ